MARPSDYLRWSPGCDPRCRAQAVVGKLGVQSVPGGLGSVVGGLGIGRTVLLECMAMGTRQVNGRPMCCDRWPKGVIGASFQWPPCNREVVEFYARRRSP
jgi:hypothetical protein